MIRGKLLHPLKWLKVHTGHVVTLSIAVGIIAGLGAVAFSLMLDRVDAAVMVGGAGYVMPRPGAEGSGQVTRPPSRRWFLILSPALGGLLCGLLIYTLAPEAEGHGTDSVVDAFHRRNGFIRARVPIVKTIASVLTIGTGGSAGREGPIGQIGAGFGSALATLLRTSDRDRRLLLLAGAGAGIGAIFRAPLGGALFAVEVLYRDAEFESAALVPAFVAAIIAYSIYCGITGVWGPIFNVPSLQFLNPLELPFYLLLGLACVPMGALYVKVFYTMRDGFRRLAVPNHLKPAIGGLAVGIMGYFVPQVLGMGYGWVQLAIDGNLTLKLTLLLLVMKIVATGLTIGSGGSGGVFAPSVVLGGLLGYGMGTFFHHLVPHIVTQPAAFALVGMAAFFAGCAKVPVSSLVMVSEMTSGYGLLVPLMLSNAVAFLLTPRKISIYEKQVDSRVDSDAHAGEFFFDVLARIHVKDAMNNNQNPIAFQRDAPLSSVLQAISTAHDPVFPVLNPDGSLFGVIDLDDIRVLLGGHSLPMSLVVAEDICSKNVEVTTPQEDLAAALRKLRKTRLEALPVTSPESGAIVGLLSRRDISNAYHDQLYLEEDGRER